MSRALFILALTLMPLSSLLGSLLYLLWWLIPGRCNMRIPAGLAPEPGLSSPAPSPPLRSPRAGWSWPEGFRFRAGGVLLGGFAGLSLLTLFVCAIPLWHLAGWLSRYLLPGLLVWGSWHALHKGRLAAADLITGLLAGSLALASVGLVNYFLHWQTHLQLLCSPAYGGFCLLDLLLLAEDRARSFSTHPNVLGALLALVVPLWLLRLGQAKALQKLPVLAGLGLVTLCLLVSYSRASWLAAGLSLLLGSFWFLNASWCRGLWLVAGAGFALFAALGKLQPLLDRFGELLGGVGSHASRLTLWRAGLAMLRDHFWFGTGLLQLEPLIPAYAPPVAGGAGHLHNWYLQVAVESGLLAALCLFAALGLLLAVPGRLSPTGQAAWLSWAGMALACCFDISLLDLRVAFGLCLLLGLCLAEQQAQARPRF